ACNGTTVNGRPIQDWQLADGDVTRVGHTEITVRFDQPRRAQTRGTAVGHQTLNEVAGRIRPATATRTREEMSNAGTRTAALTRPPAGLVVAVHLSGAPRAQDGRVRQRGHALVVPRRQTGRLPQSDRKRTRLN